MKLLTPSGAKHFCGGFTAAPTTAKMDVRDYLRTRSGAFAEGDARFSELRDCLVRESERSAFLSAVAYASSMRAVRASAASWTVVGLYYSAFFAARSVLAMHGGWIDGADRWVEVTKGNPGTIELSYKRTPHPIAFKNGSSHKTFWAVFYAAVLPLKSYVSSKNAFAFQPIQSSNTWLIDNRNKLNYNPCRAIDLLWDFIVRFNGQQLPQCFPGDLKVFLNITEAMQEIVRDFRGSTHLASDVFTGQYANFGVAVNDLIRTTREVDLEKFAGGAIAAFPI